MFRKQTTMTFVIALVGTEEGPQLLNNILCTFLKEMIRLRSSVFRSCRKTLTAKAVTAYQRRFSLIRFIWLAVDSITEIKTKKADISTVKYD